MKRLPSNSSIRHGDAGHCGSGVGDPQAVEQQEGEGRAAHRADPSRSAGGVDAEFAELAVERRAADPEPPRDFGHAAAIMADGEADEVGLDLLQLRKWPSGRIKVSCGPPIDASGLSCASSVARSLLRPEKRDWIAMCGKCSAVSEVPSHCSAARNSTPASWRTLPGQP